MDADVERIIDGLWNASLARVAKKDTKVTRPGLGDLIDLVVPQGRILSLLDANPALGSLIYYSAYQSANRNAYILMRKLNMPADFFWKYEFWPKDRAFTTMQRVINRVFTAIMNENKEGMLELEDVDVQSQRFTISFKDCAECAGIVAERPFCYYHAGTFAGIISGLVGKEMDGYEHECASGGKAGCKFTIGLREDHGIGVALADFLAPRKLGVKVDSRLRESLTGGQARPSGNLVNIEYYQLMVANSILSNPALFSASSFTTGVEAGKKLAEVLKEVFREKKLDAVQRYYRQIKHLELQVRQEGADTVVSLQEAAETVSAMQKKEFLGFLLGELQGLFSSLMEAPLVCKDSGFEGTTLHVRLSPQV